MFYLEYKFLFLTKGEELFLLFFMRIIRNLRVYVIVICLGYFNYIFVERERLEFFNFYK